MTVSYCLMPESDFELGLARLLYQAQVNAAPGSTDLAFADFMLASFTAFGQMRERQEARYAALHGVGASIFAGALPTQGTQP